MVSDLGTINATIEIHDPWVNPEEARHEYGVELIDEPEPGAYDAVVVAVAHEQYVGDNRTIEVESLLKPDGIVFDVKGVLPRKDRYFRL